MMYGVEITGGVVTTGGMVTGGGGDANPFVSYLLADTCSSSLPAT